MSYENINWRYNIPIGSKIIIDDKTELYIFYGYNFDQSIASCFPVNSTCMIDKMIYVPIKAILSIHNTNSTLIEKEMENKLKLN
jgi:hypothetical protein